MTDLNGNVDTSIGNNEEFMTYIPSLLELSVQKAAISISIESLISYLPLFSHDIRILLFTNLSPLDLYDIEQNLIHLSIENNIKNNTKEENYLKMTMDIQTQQLYKDEIHKVWQLKCKDREIIEAFNRGIINLEELKEKAPIYYNYRTLYWTNELRTLFQTTSSIEISSKFNTFAVIYTQEIQILKLRWREMTQENSIYLNQLKQLKRIEIHGYEPKDGKHWNILVNLLKTHGNLSSLGFLHGRFQIQRLKQLGESLMERNMLKTTNESCVETMGLNIGIQRCPITTLEFVSMKFERGCDKILTDIFKNLKQLKVLRCTSCKLSSFALLEDLLCAIFAMEDLEICSLDYNDLGGKHLSTAILYHLKCKSLHELNLSHNVLQSGVLESISKSMMSNGLKLKRLNLMENAGLWAGPCVTIHAGALFRSLPSTFTTTITYLDLQHVNMSTSNLMILLKALEKNTVLNYLDLSHNYLEPEVTKPLSTLLLCNSVLQSLHLNYIGFESGDHFVHLQAALMENMGLERLSFGANRLKNEGALGLFQAILHRCRIKPYAFLDLQANLITKDGLLAILNALNQGGDEEVPSKRQKLIHHAIDRKIKKNPLEILVLLNNNFDGVNNKATLAAIEAKVGLLISNVWNNQEIIYDDEV